MSCLLEAAVIACDAGHGGIDHGAEAGGIREKDLTLVYADALTDRLRQLGHTPVPTRTTDVHVELAARAALANGRAATAFVSLHFNASGSDAGAWAWVIHAAPSSRGQALATAVGTALRHAGPPVLPCRPDRVVPDASPWTGGRRLAVLRQTRMPAVIAELGFLTNPGDRFELTQPGTPDATARAIAEGIEAWLRAEILEGRGTDARAR